MGEVEIHASDFIYNSSECFGMSADSGASADPAIQEWQLISEEQ